MILVNIFVCVSCAEKPNFVEKDGIKVAVEDTSHIPKVEETELLESEILYVKQVVETIEGKTLIIDGRVSHENVEKVSRYKYILSPITEKLREELFQIYFEDRVGEIEYDEKNNVWTLNNSSVIGDYYLFTTFYPRAGATVSGEEAFQIEYRSVNLYPFEDNLLQDASMSKAKVSLEDAINMCDNIVKGISNLKDVSVNYAHAYGTEGRRPYYKLIYKRTLDNMPVTAYNDLFFLVDDDGIEKICGTTYDVEEIPLKKPILSVTEAVDILNTNCSLINFEEEDSIFVGKITLEYIVTNSSSGETYISPAWRFYLGDTESQMNFSSDKILAVDAVTGDIIQEERGNTF